MDTAKTQLGLDSGELTGAAPPPHTRRRRRRRAPVETKIERELAIRSRIFFSPLFFVFFFCFFEKGTKRQIYIYVCMYRDMALVWKTRVSWCSERRHT